MSQEGWRCPGCSRCFAPDVKECPHCQQNGVSVTGHMRLEFIGPDGKHYPVCPRCNCWYKSGSTHSCATGPLLSNLPGQGT